MSVQARAAYLALALAASVVAIGALSWPAAATPTPASASGCPCPAQGVLPVAFAALDGGARWTLTFLTPPCPPVVEIRVGVDGRKPVSLGGEETVDPATHRRAARRLLVLGIEALADGKIAPDDDHELAVQLVRPGGRVDGPYKLLFSPREERLAEAKVVLARSPRSWASFAEHGSVYTWLYFQSLFAMRGSLREVRYSVNDCRLAHRLVFSPLSGDEPTADRRYLPDDLTFERPFLSLSRETTSSACLQVVFADGTVSDVLELHRDPKAPPR